MPIDGLALLALPTWSNLKNKLGRDPDEAETRAALQRNLDRQIESLKVNGLLPYIN